MKCVAEESAVDGRRATGLRLLESLRVSIAIVYSIWIPEGVGVRCCHGSCRRQRLGFGLWLMILTRKRYEHGMIWHCYDNACAVCLEDGLLSTSAQSLESISCVLVWYKVLVEKMIETEHIMLHLWLTNSRAEPMELTPVSEGRGRETGQG